MFCYIKAVFVPFRMWFEVFQSCVQGRGQKVSKGSLFFSSWEGNHPHLSSVMILECAIFRPFVLGLLPKVGSAGKGFHNSYNSPWRSNELAQACRFHIDRVSYFMALEY